MTDDGTVRLRLRYPDVDTFVEKFAPNVSRGGVFLASKSPRPVGDQFRFEVSLKDGRAVLAGEGKVTWIKEFDPAQPAKPHGMGVQFIRVDVASKALLDRIMKAKGAAPRRSATPIANGTEAGSGAVAAPARPSLEDRLAAADVSPSPKTNGAGPGANVDGLVAELGVEESAIRRALERARSLGIRSEDLDALTAPEPEEEVSVARALSELPRILGRPGDGGTRRRTGSFRTLDPPKHGGSNGSNGAS